jgi:predicted GH43/DUF377 family glycosyl hydrolase
LPLTRSPEGMSGWLVSDRPTLEADLAYHEERWGIDDPRIVWMEELGRYAVTCVSFSKDRTQRADRESYG